MKKIIFIILCIGATLLFACSNEEKKPFGAENIDYNKVQEINKDGPNIESGHNENTPPISDKTNNAEAGPIQIDYSNTVVEPTADMDEEPDYGGIPIVTKERN